MSIPDHNEPPEGLPCVNHRGGRGVENAVGGVSLLHRRLLRKQCRLCGGGIEAAEAAGPMGRGVNPMRRAGRHRGRHTRSVSDRKTLPLRFCLEYERLAQTIELPYPVLEKGSELVSAEHHPRPNRKCHLMHGSVLALNPQDTWRDKYAERSLV